MTWINEDVHRLDKKTVDVLLAAGLDLQTAVTLGLEMLFDLFNFPWPPP